LAAQSGNTDIINILLDRGIKKENTDANNYTALHYATYQGKTEAVKLLVNRGCDINGRGNKGQSALDLAAQQKHLPTMHALLDAGANPNNIDEEYKNDPRGGGKTALHRAAISGDVEVAKILVEHGLKNGLNLDLLDKGNQPLGVIPLAQGNITEGG